EFPPRPRAVERHYREHSMVTRHDPGAELKTRLLGMLRNPPPIPQTNGPLLLTVSIAKQTITLYDAGVEIAKAPISSGTTAMPTPMGVFSVLEKNWWHRSNMYSAAPMPYMQRITWSGVALHAGELPGYRASHGCVRLPESFALRLWYTTRVGARVVIAWDEVAPAEIAHPRLFRLKPGQPDGTTPPKPPASDIISLSVPSQDDPRDDGTAPAATAAATATVLADEADNPDQDEFRVPRATRGLAA